MAYSYYCNKALDDLVIQGRSTLDSRQRAPRLARPSPQHVDNVDLAFLSERVEQGAGLDEIRGVEPSTNQP
jgi:hypothetical protein